MNAIKKILKFLGVILLILLVISLFLPSKVHVERIALVHGSPEVTFQLINKLPEWEKWSPWHRIDPNMKLEYGQQVEGKGATYSWKSDHKNVGNGAITIAESRPSEYIKTEMNFMENGVATAEYFLTPKEGGTEVRWTMDSDMGWNLIGRYFGLMIDKWVGEDYEKGLHYLDSVAHLVKPAAFAMQLEPGKMPAMKLLLIKATCKEAEIGQTLGKIYGQLGPILQSEKLEMAGAPMAMYDDPKDGIFTFEAGFPVSGKPKMALPKDVIYKETTEMDCIITHFSGPYEKTAEAYPAMEKWMKENGKQIAGKPMESYISDPMEAKTPMDIKTDIFWPVR